MSKAKASDSSNGDVGGELAARVHTIAIVPARSGSKGLPAKNLERIGARSLVERGVDVALSVSAIHTVYVSSDSEAILSQGRRAGALARHRPEHLATDEASLVDVVLDLLMEEPLATQVVLLQPTSPLRSRWDVIKVLDALTAGNESVMTVTAWGHPIEWSVHLDSAGRTFPVFPDQASRRRQELPEAFRPNGAVYGCTTDFLKARHAFACPESFGIPMPFARSIDIDTAEDLEIARAISAAGLA